SLGLSSGFRVIVAHSPVAPHRIEFTFRLHWSLSITDWQFASSCFPRSAFAAAVTFSYRSVDLDLTGTRTPLRQRLHSRTTKVRWTEKAFEAFKDKLRGLTGRSWGVSMEYRMKKLREYIRGWMGYFGRSEYYRLIPALDEWLRRRMRMCYRKQWRKSRKRINQLIKLGANERYAIQTGLSRKGYWRLSRTLATNSGMTNRWLEEQGLISIREVWIGIHYPATAR
ncbi:MAG: hypothetical protein O2960_27685, partial [Verrucomicrobia bacterium]|nr:hypothetical protein [Verrucomicrobiota bacterium]